MVNIRTMVSQAVLRAELRSVPYVLLVVLFMFINREALAQLEKVALASTDYVTRLQDMEKMSTPRRPITLSLADDRRYQTLKFRIGPLRDSLQRKLMEQGFEVGEIANFPEGITPFVIDATVSYYGFYETAGGMWGGKGIIGLEFIDPNQPANNAEETVATDILFRKSRRPKQEWKDEVVRQTLTETVEAVEKLTESSGKPYRRVTTYGIAPVDDGNGMESHIDAAIQDALRRGAERAWGLSLESTTTFRDLADVTAQTKTSGSGVIMHYEVLDEHTRLTSDNQICVLVRSVIKQPSQ